MLNDIEAQPLKHHLALSVKRLPSNLGFMEVWLSQGVGNEQRFLEIFKTRVKDIFMQVRHSQLETSSRARFYNTFASFRYQNYLDVVEIDKYRTSISKLRLSSQRLEVEVGRWVKPNKRPYDNWKCKICDCLEDEFHFVLECSLYVENRKEYILETTQHVEIHRTSMYRQ